MRHKLQQREKSVGTQDLMSPQNRDIPVVQEYRILLYTFASPNVKPPLYSDFSSCRPCPRVTRLRTTSNGGDVRRRRRRIRDSDGERNAVYRSIGLPRKGTLTQNLIDYKNTLT